MAMIGISLEMYRMNHWLVVEPYPSEKYESQLGWLFPIYGEKKMFQTRQPDHSQRILNDRGWISTEEILQET